MDFLAHFSFDGAGSGYFTMLVDAKNPEEAIDKFRAKILKVKKEGELFEGVERIFLDDIIQINKITQQAAVLRFESTSSDGTRLSINPVDGKNLEAFQWFPEGKEEECDKGEYTVEPFVEFKK